MLIAHSKMYVFELKIWKKKYRQYIGTGCTRSALARQMNFQRCPALIYNVFCNALCPLCIVPSQLTSLTLQRTLCITLQQCVSILYFATHFLFIPYFTTLCVIFTVFCKGPCIDTVYCNTMLCIYTVFCSVLCIYVVWPLLYGIYIYVLYYICY